MPLGMLMVEVLFDRWSANDLASLLVGILDQQGFWDPKDAEVLLSVARIIDDALSRYDNTKHECCNYVRMRFM